MDRIIDIGNLVACGLLAAGALWAVLSPRVQDGIVIKIGLGAMSLGFAALGFAALGAALADGRELQHVGRALGLVHLGLLVVAAGIGIRWKRAGRVYRIDEWITPPTVAIHRPERKPPGGSTLEMEDAQRGSRL